jgi:hypothetical protein
VTLPPRSLAETQPSRPCPPGPLWADLLALVAILGAAVAIVVFGHAGAAVLATSGGLVAAAFGKWKQGR